MTAPAVSIILCTHNPRPEFLAGVFQSLAAQSLDRDAWELLLIDNASGVPVAVEMAWHPNARLLREDTLGLVHARRRGIREAAGELLVFVDDDNVLESNYLREAMAIAAGHPKIGVFGGTISPRFEVDAPAWTRPYWPWLAIRTLSSDRWSRRADDYEAMPCGAGMCVRRIVAERWVERLAAHPGRLALGRTGTRLLSGEDSDLAMTACDMGLGMGVFTALKLTHLIPAGRLKEDYIVSLIEGTAYSNLRLSALRETLPTPNLRREWLALVKALLKGKRNFRLARAAYRGRRAAYRDVAADRQSNQTRAAALAAAEA